MYLYDTPGQQPHTQYTRYTGVTAMHTRDRTNSGSVTHLASPGGLSHDVIPLDPHLLRGVIVDCGAGGCLRLHLYEGAIEETLVEVRGLQGRYPVVIEHGRQRRERPSRVHGGR